MTAVPRKRNPDAGARIRFWVSTAELAMLRVLAAEYGCTPAQAAKQLVIQATPEYHVALMRKMRDMLPAMTAEEARHAFLGKEPEA